MTGSQTEGDRTKGDKIHNEQEERRIEEMVRIPKELTNREQEEQNIEDGMTKYRR